MGWAATMRIENATQICTNPAPGTKNDSYVYVGVFGPYVGEGWAQIGFNQDATHSPHIYYEYSTVDPVTNPNTQRVSQYYNPGGSGLVVGSSHLFQVNSTSACGYCFSLNYDTTRIANTTWSGEVDWDYPGTTNWGYDVSGETGYGQTNIPGLSTGGVATVISGVKGQRYSDNGWELAPCSLLVGDNPLYFRYGMNGSANHGCGSWSIFTN